VYTWIKIKGSRFSQEQKQSRTAYPISNSQERNGNLRREAYSEPEEEAGLADGGVADDEQLEEVVAATGGELFIYPRTSKEKKRKGWTAEKAGLTTRCRWPWRPRFDDDG